MTRSVFINVQTTGVRGEDRVSEISLLEMIDGERGKRLDFKIDPEKEYSDVAAKLTGHDRADFEGKQKFSDVKDQVAKFLTGSDFLVTHCKWFHGSKLDAEFTRCDMPSIKSYCNGKILDLHARAVTYYGKDNGNTLEKLTSDFRESTHDLRTGQYQASKKVDNLFVVMHGMARDQKISLDDLLIAGTQEKPAKAKKAAPKKGVAKARPVLFGGRLPGDSILNNKGNPKRNERHVRVRPEEEGVGPVMGVRK